MHTNYLCWRITGELLNSIEGCPVGSMNDCMQLVEGDTCPGGKEITI